MVFESDPRAGYCDCEFNLTWYLEYLSERNMKLVNLGKTDEDIKVNEIGLYNQIDILFNRFVAWKVFGFKHSQLAYVADCDSWYDTLHTVVDEFVDKNPDMWKLCDVDEE